MSELISNFVGIAGTLLQVLALILLIRGPVSRYFPLVLFLFTSSAVTVAQGWVLNTRGGGDPLYFNVYWGGELLLDSLVFFLVISLTVRALEGNPLKPKVVRFLSIILSVVVALPFVLFESHIFDRRWNQSVGQLLNFGAAVMNLGLWSALVVSKQRDRQLLTVSAGLGVAVAGAALTLGVRQFTHQGDVLREISDFVHRMSQIASPAIWCWAFRPAKPRLSPPGVPTTATV